MAKKKTTVRKKRSTGSKSLTKRINSMAKRKTVRRKSPVRRKTKARKTSLSSNGGGARKKTWVKSFMDSLGGSVGGAAYAVPQMAISLPWWGKIALGVGIGTVGHKFNMPNVGSGASGAMTFDMLKSNSPIPLKDDYDLQDYDYVDEDTLSDSGFELADGSPVLIDEEGEMYSMNDEGELMYLGDSFDLQDDFDLQDSLDNVSMVPLQEGYPY